MIYLVTIVVIILPFALLFAKKTINPESKIANNMLLRFLLDDKYIEVLINLSVTVLGVTLAILFTNADTQQKDTEKTVALLSSMYDELEDVQTTIDEWYIPACNQVDVEESEQEGVTLFLAQPLVEIFTMDTILGHELIVSNTHSSSYAAMTDAKRSIALSFNRLETISNDEDLMRELEMLSESIEFVKRIVDLEISYQMKSISANDLESRIEDVYVTMLSE